MIFNFARLTLVCFISKLGINSALAKDEHYGYGNDIAKISANLRIGYDTNLYDSPLTKKSGFFYQPSLRFLTDSKTATYGFQGGYAYDLFVPDTNKDLAHSHALSINSYWSPIPSNSFFFSADMKKIDERRGTGLTSDDLDLESKLDSFKYHSFQGGYNFDRLSQESFIFLLSYGINQKKYDSDRNLALNANLEQKIITANLGYKWTSKKKIYINTSKTTGNYPDLPNNSKNSVNKIFSIGMTWPFSNISSISIDYGKENKHIDARSESSNTNYWSGKLNWSPLSYTHLSLESINKQKPISKINQTFNESTSLVLNLKYIRSKVNDITFSIREEKTEEKIQDEKRKENKILSSIANKYRDFLLTLTFEKNKKHKKQSVSKFSISLDYSFRGII